MNELGILDRLLETAKEKISKKQILAVIAMFVILQIEIPPEIKYQALFLGIKIACIAAITIVALTFQWNLDKEKKYEKKNNLVSDGSGNLVAGRID